MVRSRAKRGPARRAGGAGAEALRTGRVSNSLMARLPSQQRVLVHKWGAPTVLTQAQADTFGAFQFELTDTEASSVAAFWQQYQIQAIEMQFRPMYRANPVIDDTVCVIPLIFVAVDPNDISSWTTLSQAESHDNVAIKDDDRGFTLRLRPSVAAALYAGAFTAFGHFPQQPWIDTASNSVRHYGVKWAITGSGFAASHYQSWRVISRYTVAFRYGK